LAIVNAASECCLGGGGIDGAINNAGGRTLIADRRSLPIITHGGGGNGVRCHTGNAVITGPNSYTFQH
jgi:O-acetyl-ADP-ribose deacetylase